MLSSFKAGAFLANIFSAIFGQHGESVQPSNLVLDPKFVIRKSVGKFASTFVAYRLLSAISYKNTLATIEHKNTACSIEHRKFMLSEQSRMLKTSTTKRTFNVALG